MIESNPAWPAIVPESEWTPFQRQWMEADRRAGRWLTHQSRLLLWAERRRHDRQWISLAEIADWCARVPGDVARDEQRRAQTWRDILLSAERGDFTRRGRLRLAYVPPFNMLRAGPISSRLMPAQLSLYTLTHCWVPHKIAVQWLLAQRLDLMPGMSAPTEEVRAQTAAPTDPKAEKSASKPPFEPRRAKALLAAEKVSGHWREPPSDEATLVFLRKHFNGVPNDRWRQIRREVWPGKVQRGRKGAKTTAN